MSAKRPHWLLVSIGSGSGLALNSLRLRDACMHQQINHYWFRWWLVTWAAPSHYLNQCWNIVNWNRRYKLQWNLKWNSYIFIQENAFVNVVCEMAAILSWPQHVTDNKPLLEPWPITIYKPLLEVLSQCWLRYISPYGATTPWVRWVAQSQIIQ